MVLCKGSSVLGMKLSGGKTSVQKLWVRRGVEYTFTAKIHWSTVRIVHIG